MSVARPGKYVLSIDLGTGGPKVGLVDDAGRVVASAFEHTALHFLPDDGVEQDPEEWWQAIGRASRRVMEQARVPHESIAGVGCTSQWSVIVAVDEHGAPLMNAISWMDKRGGPFARELVGGFPSIQGYRVDKLVRWLRRGIPPTRSGADSMSHMLFVKHARPDVYRRTHKFLEPMDFINLRLTGRAAATQSTVFVMAVADNRKWGTTRYDPWLLEVAGIDEAKLPELLPPDGVVGPLTASAAQALGLPPGVPVVAGTYDNHTSAIGAGAIQDYEGVAVLGTSGFLACHVPFQGTDIDSFITTLPSPLPRRYLIMGDLGNNGRVLDSFLAYHVYGSDELLEAAPPEDRYARLGRAAEASPPGANGVLFLPWFNGTLCPSEDPAMRGGFLNLSYRTRRTDLARAVLEGLSLNWRWLLGPAQRFTRRRFERLLLAGAGAQSDVWAAIMADVTGLPIHQLADPRNGNVVGMALLTFQRLGLLALEEISGRVQVARVWRPRPENQAVYDRLFAQFLACQKTLKPVFHALNGA